MLTLAPEEIEEYAAAHSTSLPPLLEELVAVTRVILTVRDGVMLIRRR